jgi:hypothetical protein
MCVFYAVVTLLLGMAAVAVIPLAGWANTRTLASRSRMVTIGGLVFFVGAAFVRRKSLGD